MKEKDSIVLTSLERLKDYINQNGGNDTMIHVSLETEGGDTVGEGERQGCEKSQQGKD